MSNRAVIAITSKDGAEDEAFYTMSTFIAAGIISVVVVLLWLACAFYGKRQERRRMRKMRELSLRLRGLRAECMERESGGRAWLPDLLQRHDTCQTTEATETTEETESTDEIETTEV